MQLDRVKLLTELVKKDMTQKQLIDASGFSRSTINSVCRGKTCNESTAKAIAAALGVSVKDLM